MDESLTYWCYRSSLSEVFCKKGILRNFAKITGKHLCQSLFIKKDTLVQVFSCVFGETSKNTFFNRISLMVASEVAMSWVQTKNKFHIKERNRGIPYVSIDVKNCVNKN